MMVKMLRMVRVIVKIFETTGVVDRLLNVVTLSC